MELSDGKHLGFIRAFTDNNTAIDFDDAVWLTGKTAEDAAIAARLCTEGTREECLPNDYYIQNVSTKTVRVPVDPTARIIMQTWQAESTGQVGPREVSITSLAATLNTPGLHWRELPFQITTEGNEVIRIEEVYIP